ncbi:cytochrome P450 [Mycena leptocephala]|nr:cytochrome P450 [Mycena leptocephala]
MTLEQPQQHLKWIENIELWRTHADNDVLMARLQEELASDQHWMEDDLVATSEQVQNLSYLDACIKEGLRIHSTIALGLPRAIPKGGLIFCGRFFPAGSVVGVPIYTLHRDPDAYRLQRWFDAGKAKAMHKAYNPFSLGPRYVFWATSESHY